MSTANSRKLQYAGEYSLERLELITINGKFDLTKNYLQLDLFEDLFSSGITGSLVITDTNNLIVNSPLVGQEYLRLKISSPGISNADAIDFSENVLSVYSIGIQEDNSKGSQIIELRLITPESLTNQRVRVSKSYSDTTDRIVEDILTGTNFINTKKNIFIEPTKGNRRIVVPNMHPFNIINNLASESESVVNPSNYHLFFENAQGYHFKSLINLFRQNTKGEYNTGDVGTINQKTQEVDDFNRVIAFQRTGSTNMLTNIMSGMLSSRLTTHDIYNKTYSSYFHDYSFDTDIPRMEKNPIYSSKPIDDLGRSIGQFYDSKIHLNSRSGTTINKSFSRGESDDDKNSEGVSSSLTTGSGLLKRKSKYAEMIGAINYNIKVVGHTQMRVGQMINFTISTVGNDHGKGASNDLISGKFLIEKLRHTFYRAPTVFHQVNMSITKDSFNDSLPEGDIVQPTRRSKFVTRTTGGDDYGAF